MMPPPGIDIAAIRSYCAQRVPPHAADDIRVETIETRNIVTVVERRPPWRDDYGPAWTELGIARFRYTAKTGLWSLYWRDRNQKWHLYDVLEPTKDIVRLIDEVDRDQTCIFWG